MFQITANPAAKTAFEAAHAERGGALRRLIARIFHRLKRKTAEQNICPAE